MLIDRRTQSNISINVSGYEDEIPCCIYTSKQTFRQESIDKFLIDIIKESEYCFRVIEAEFNKHLVMIKKDC